MKPHTQAVREAQAWDRILAAIKAQAKANGVDAASLDVAHRVPGLQQLFRMEALADFLEGEESATPAAAAASAHWHQPGKTGNQAGVVMPLPTSYNEATLAAYMVTALGDLAATLDLDEDDMAEAIGDVTLACGATDIASVTDVAKVRALGKVAALRVASITAAGWYDFAADGGDYKRSQVQAQIARLLDSAENAAMVYGPGWAVETGTVHYVDDPYDWDLDLEAEGVA